MNESGPLDAEVLVCPHCKAINPPNTIMCNSCGVRMDTYNQVKRVLVERQEEARQTHRAEQAEQARLEDETVREQIRLTFYRRMKWLGVAGVVLIVLVVLGSLAFAAVQKERERQAGLAYQRGVACQAAGDLPCAREAYLRVYQYDRAYLDARSRLASTLAGLAQAYLADGSIPLAVATLEDAAQVNPADPQVLDQLFNARLELARAYENLAQWEKAIDILEASLDQRPGDTQLIARIKGDYDSWIAQAKRKKDPLLAWQISSRKNEKYSK